MSPLLAINLSILGSHLSDNNTQIAAQQTHMNNNIPGPQNSSIEALPWWHFSNDTRGREDQGYGRRRGRS